jgi:hypothetical protein
MLRFDFRPRAWLVLAASAVFSWPAAAQFPDLAKGQPLRVLDARIGINTRLGDDPTALPASQRGQAEPHLARSVVDPELLLGTFQEGRFADGGALACGYAVSRDGGLTWRRDLIPTLTTTTGGRFARATDPVAGCGPQGDLYLQTLGSVQGVFDQAAVVVSRSTDQGATWSAPFTVFESTAATPSPDKNWLAIQDYPAGANRGRLVSTWTGFINTANSTQSAHLVSSFSDDRGTTWSAPVNITPTGTLHQGSQPLFLPDGSLVVVYITFLNSSNNVIDIRCKRSADGGRTYPADAVTVVPTFTAWDDPQVRDGVFLPAAAVSRQTGEVFVTYTAVLNGTPRVLLTRSSTQGATWTTPVVVSDQPTGISVMNPTVAATADGRTVTVFYMDKRDAPGGRDFVDFYATASFDGGATWQPSLRVSELSSELRYGPLTSRGTMLGDYFAVVPPTHAAQPFVAIWCDTRTGDSDPFVARLAMARSPGIEAWTVARFSPAQQADRSLLELDSDGDGHSNLAEYTLGTDPLRAEGGQSFVLRRPTAGTLDVIWLQRSTVESSTLVLRATHATTGQALTGQPLATAALPTSAPTGLAWQGQRYAAPASVPFLAQLAHPVATGNGFAEDTPVVAANTDSRLVNLSTRGRTGPTNNPLIVGFVIDGNKSILLRAAGPALASVGLSGVVPDPQLNLTAIASDLQRRNDNWADGGASAALFARLGAFPFAAGSRDAALALQLGAQSYTAVAADVADATGILLVEAYDADAVPGALENPRLLNLSTRGEAGAGNNALIAGFVLSGTQPRQILVRAVGPGLTSFSIAAPLADPVVTLYRQDRVIAANDDWATGRSAGAIEVAAARAGAFSLPRASRDAALLVTLAPGAYTVVVTGANVGTGIALVEIYDAD